MEPSMLELIVERESANDIEGTVVAVLAESGTVVTKDQHLFDVETSKATQEVCAPMAGVLRHTLKTGDVVELGVAIARIEADGQPSQETAQRPAASSPAKAGGEAGPVSTTHLVPRLSHDAAALA